MNAYDLMIKTNHYLIKGGSLTDLQKDNIVSQLLSAQTIPEQAKRFYNGVKFPNNIDGEGRQMYPVFYIPQYNDGLKLKTIFNQTPKTHIFSKKVGFREAGRRREGVFKDGKYIDVIYMDILAREFEG
jgi:hypothetical protein